MRRLRIATVFMLTGALAACEPRGARAPSSHFNAPTHDLHTLPEWAPVGGFAVGRHVFLKPSQQNAIGIGHELVHLRQQAEHPLWFWVSYAASPRWRLRWEAEAYAVQARAGCPVDGEHGLAAYLAGKAYLWPGTAEEAKREILRFR